MPTHSLFRVLSFDQRVIVASREDCSFIVTWNMSLTLQLWHENDGRFTEIDVRTLSTEPSSFAEARTHAVDWMAE